jgi:hypothetical protein
MNHDEYGHDFQDGKRNGWENDVGSLDGILKSEDDGGCKNTFWSGKLEYRPPNTFLPSLAKMFTFPGPKQDKEEKGFLFTSFRYRVHSPEAGEATMIGVVVTANISLGYTAFYIDERTPTEKWIQSDPIGVRYSGTKAHIVIGSHVAVPGVSRKIDIDDIKVERVPDK